MRICHLTSVHHRDDTRIFIKEIPALVREIDNWDQEKIKLIELYQSLEKES